MKIAVLFDNFGPYHWARLRETSNICDLLAVEFGRCSDEYEWKDSSLTEIRHEIVNRNGTSSELPNNRFRAELTEILERFQPEVVAIPGWSCRGALLAMEWAISCQIPIVLMSDSTALDKLRVNWKEAIKRPIVRLASAALVAGTPHAEYIQQLGMPATNVTLGYDVVDNDYFSKESKKWSITDSSINMQNYFLNCSRFMKVKNLIRVLDAYSHFVKETANLTGGNYTWNLCLLGDGELKADLIAQCVKLGLQIAECAPWESAKSGNKQHPTVFFAGFRQIDELPRFYAHAGVLVHASTSDTWGLVVNEAMASGLPVIVSNRVGCMQDLVKDGVNGYTFDPHQVHAIATLMSEISQMPQEDRMRMGQMSTKIITDWGPERFATGLKTAFDKAIEVGPKRAGLIDRLLLQLLIRR